MLFRSTLLRDADGDGVYETRGVFAQGLNAPYGLALVGSYLYVANQDALVRFDYAPGQTQASGAPVEISCDLGFRDTAAWWFWQPRLDGFGVVGYLGASGMDADDWIDRLRHYLTMRGMRLGKIWMPHDARAKTFGAKHSPMERFLEAFGHDKVGIVPMTRIEHRTNAARRVIGRCYFDEDECGDGLDGLVSWQYEYDQELKVFSKEPLHDWASHPGDAFSYGAQMLEERMPKKEMDSSIRGLMVGNNHGISLDEMWQELPRRNTGRI